MTVYILQQVTVRTYFIVFLTFHFVEILKTISSQAEMRHILKQYYTPSVVYVNLNETFTVRMLSTSRAGKIVMEDIKEKKSLFMQFICCYRGDEKNY
jgi:hypothetical protein